MVDSGSRGPRGDARSPQPQASMMRQMTNTRVGIVVTAVIVVAVILIARLAWVQVVWGPDLREQAQIQRTRVYVDPARRGQVVDREGNQLAYTMQALSLIHI